MENQTTPQPEQPPQPAPSDKKPGYYMSKLQWTFFSMAFGGIIGFFIATHATELMADITPTIITVGLTLFFVSILLFIVLPKLFKYYIKRYTKQDVDVETLVGDLQSKTTDISIALSNAILINTDPKIKANIQADLPKVLYYFVFSRLRNTGLRFMMTTFAAIAGLMGTILLYNQNQLLMGQNELLTGQNEKIDRQILLEEASRRSSLNFLMANVLDKIDEELKVAEKTGKPRRLSTELIGRIASLSQSFQPYRFMDGDTMIREPLSPERGNLLLAIVNSNLDTFTLKEIFQKTTFEYANLRGAYLDSTYIVGANLSKANLTEAYLSNSNLINIVFAGANLVQADFSESNLSQADFLMANLSGADLSLTKLIDVSLFDANLYRADLSLANLSGADLSLANLSGANLTQGNLTQANLTQANLTQANLYYVKLKGSDINRADISGAIGLTEEMLSSCKSIYGLVGLSDSFVTKFKAEMEEKPYWVK